MITYILGLGCIGLLIAIFIIYKHFKKLIKTEQYKEEETFLNELNNKKDVALREFQKFKADLEEQMQTNSSLVELEREKALRDLQSFLEELQTKRIQSELELQGIVSVLTELKSRRETINQDLLREREIRCQKDFFTLLLRDCDIEDIKILRSIESKLTNKEALNKLIYEVFYKKPLSDLLGRVLKGKEPCGIYKITNQLTQEIYIGKSTNIKRRWTEHVKSSLDIGTIAKTKIHSAIKDNGIENFTWEVLEECSKSIYSEREKFYIDFFESDKYGYNMQKG